MANAIGGIIRLLVDSKQLACKGDFTYNLGLPLRETEVGSDGVHGYTTKPQPAMIEGTVTEVLSGGVDWISKVDGSTITLQTADGRVFSFRDCYYTGEGNVKTEKGELDVKFESRYEATEI